MASKLLEAMDELRSQWPDGSISVNFTHMSRGNGHYYVGIHGYGNCVHGKSDADPMVSFEDALQKARERWPDERTAALRNLKDAEDRLRRAREYAAKFETQAA